MPAFLAPILGGAARVLGTRALGAGATRLGAGVSRSNLMSAVQFGAKLASQDGGGSSEQPRTPGPVQIG